MTLVDSSSTKINEVTHTGPIYYLCLRFVCFFGQQQVIEEKNNVYVDFDG